jgi:hypothetical protein
MLLSHNIKRREFNILSLGGMGKLEALQTYSPAIEASRPRDLHRSGLGRPVDATPPEHEAEKQARLCGSSGRKMAVGHV